jgi:hypothetical protein
MFCRSPGHDFVFRKRSPLGQPIPQQRHLFGGESSALRRHALVLVVRKDPGEDFPVAFPGDERSGVEPEVALLFEGAMAGGAAVAQERSDLAWVVDRLQDRDHGQRANEERGWEQGIHGGG